eukprot:Partr_v1_DN27135_c1_g1_i2_m15581 putative mannose-6-phosphate isomerase
MPAESTAQKSDILPSKATAFHSPRQPETIAPPSINNLQKSTKPSMNSQGESVVFRLSCRVQNYAWGKVGSASAVAQLSANAVQPQPQINEQTPYAELWMGTHTSAPSVLYDNDNLSLLDAVRQLPGALTPAVEARFRNDLPFLFKVLSVGKALSIQAHPDIALAEALHQKFPTIYKDANHKPEMCIALTTFEGLCGFRQLNEIAENLERYPEFAQVVGSELAQEFVQHIRSDADKAGSKILPPSMRYSDPVDRKYLRRLFEALMTAEENTVKTLLHALISRIHSQEGLKKDLGVTGSLPELLTRLNEQYPGDVGCFCALMLNYVMLRAGEAMFLAANEPHAYLAGDCVECMATSDNVVRAGLTPKLKDVDTLVNMLTYKTYSLEDILMKKEAHTAGSHSSIFRSPVQEFSIIETKLSQGTKGYFEGIGGPSIVLFVEGSGSFVVDSGSQYQFMPGSVYFIGSGATVEFHASAACKMYRAFCDMH